MITFAGAHFPVHSEVECLFSLTAKPLMQIRTAIATYVADDTVLCQTPRFDQVGGAKAALRWNAAQTTAELDFQILETEPKSVVQILPAAGPIAGGTLIALVTHGITPSDVTTCGWNDMKTPATFQTSTLTSCRSPELLPGRVTVTIQGDVDVVGGPSHFAALSVFHLISAQVFNLRSPEEQVLKVIGSGFQNVPDLTCVFSDGSSDQALWLSETVLRCLLRSSSSRRAIPPRVASGMQSQGLQTLA